MVVKRLSLIMRRSGQINENEDKRLTVRGKGGKNANGDNSIRTHAKVTNNRQIYVPLNGCAWPRDLEVQTLWSHVTVLEEGSTNSQSRHAEVAEDDKGYYTL
jgi:hypothetical protein